MVAERTAPDDDAPHILVVDDDTRIRTLLKQFLAEQGYRVSIAANAAEARRRLEGLDFDLIVLDDFGLTPMADSTQRDLLEILDDRYAKKSTLITSQLPIDQWHTYLGDPTLADAILDRLVHNSHRLTLTGESMRKRAAAKITTTSIPSA